MKLISNLKNILCEKEKRTEDEGDNDGLHVLSAGLVGISRKVGDVEAKRGVVTQDSVEI
jgi:hypothetical protein